MSSWPLLKEDFPSEACFRHSIEKMQILGISVYLWREAFFSEYYLLIHILFILSSK